jgi:hypothetical protein
MKLTNKFNIPKSIYDKIAEGIYKPPTDRIRVTELINPPLIKHLTLEHWDEIEVDASERLWAFLGTVCHDTLSKRIKATALNETIEKRETITISNTVISSRADLRKNGIIEDFKITSVGSFLRGLKLTWEQQLNMYAFIAKCKGIPIYELKVNAILRDWSIGKAMQHDYPSIPFLSMKVPLWSGQKQQEFVISRVAAHKAEPIECSFEERWEKPTSYVVKKKGVKKALAATKKKGNKRVEMDISDCENYIKNKNLTEQFRKGVVYIEKRIGERTRCKGFPVIGPNGIKMNHHYCQVYNFCPFNPYKGA